jgi:superfamily II DNA/RNA helicase
MGTTLLTWCHCGAQLEAEGHRCTSISGELDHEQRDRTVKEFRSGTTKILISTDVLSRGFDVTQARHTNFAPRN